MGWTGAVVAVHLQAVDEPVRVLKRGRVVLDKGLARRGLGAAYCVGAPDVAGPVAAERDVEDELLIVDLVVDVAGSCKLALRQTPAGGIGGAAGDVRRDASAGEEPDADGFTGPFGGEDAPADGVEAGAKAAVVAAPDGTARV